MNKLTEILDIEFPIIMAPMFLVTNEKMMISAANSGIAACIPAHNYRTPKLLEAGLKNIRNKSQGCIGVNLIVNQSNVYYPEQLKTCIREKVDFIITSLGNPKDVINACKGEIKVFCDVINLEHAKKVEGLGADAIIAVNSGAGGHLGNLPASVLIPMLRDNCQIPIISAGGVGTGEGIQSMLKLGACGLSIGSPFIATKECDVSQDYKDAVVKYGANDIVVTTKLSGTPCTIINTPYVQKTGTKQNFIERMLNKNKQLKKYAKMLSSYKGMKAIEKAAFKSTYKTVWCAGPSIQFVNNIVSVKELIDRLKKEFNEPV